MAKKLREPKPMTFTGVRATDFIRKCDYVGIDVSVDSTFVVTLHLSISDAEALVAEVQRMLLK